MWNSGFFNALLQGNVYDRKYNADDYSNALSMIVGNGIVNTENGTSLKVALNGTASVDRYALKIAQGWGWIKGKWVHNDSDDTISQVNSYSTENITQETGTYTLNNIPMSTKNFRRRDALFLRSDTTTNGRIIYPTIRLGSETQASFSETLDTHMIPIQQESVYEICLAHIYVDYSGDTPIVTVEDRRMFKEYGGYPCCGWVNGYFGDDWEEYCASIQETVTNFLNNKTGEFNRWFGGVRDEVASVTLQKQIKNSVTVPAAGKTFSIGIAEYNPELDILEVYTNGVYEWEGTDYTIDATNKTVTFLYQKNAGTTIDFVVTKAIDGRFYENADEVKIADVEGRITDITTTLADQEETTQLFTYISTGEDDNIKLCDKVKAFLQANLTDRRMLKINVISKDKEFVVTQPCYSGAQSGLETYNRYFDFSTQNASNRRFILDFANCSPITIDIPNSTNCVLFYGANQKIYNCVLKAGSTTNSGTKIVGVYGTNDVYYKNCRFGITASSSLEFAYHGVYEDCEVTLTSLTGNATAFYPRPNGDIVQVIRGVYFLFTTQTALDNGFNTKLIYHSLQGEASSTAVSICRDVLVPSPTRSGFVTNGYFFHTTGGYVRGFNNITTRSNNITNTDSEITGTIPLSRGKGQTPFI